MINFIKDAIDFAYNSEKVYKSLAARNHPEDYEPVNITAKAYSSGGKYEKLIRINFDYMQRSSYSVQREDLTVLVGMRDGGFEVLEMKAIHEIPNN